MNRRQAVLATASALATGLAFVSAPAQAQARALKKQLVGTWMLAAEENRAADGTKTSSFGGNPQGMLVIAASGRFNQMIMGDARRRFAANTRTKGTAEENQAAMLGSIAYFGTWTVDEKARTIALKITVATYANWDGVTQVRAITGITASEFRWHNPDASAGGTTELIWKRAT
jgi:Lipocalin-like domain